MLSHSCGNPGGSGPFWEEGQDLWVRQRPGIHLAALFGAVWGGWGREEERGGSFQCQTETLGISFKILICLGDILTLPSRDLVKFLLSFLPGLWWLLEQPEGMKVGNSPWHLWPVCLGTEQGSFQISSLTLLKSLDFMLWGQETWELRLCL